MTVQIITIDGPSGSGKGTLAAKIAAHYHFNLLDSGALYRLLGLSLFQKGLLNQIEAKLDQCIDYATHLDIDFREITPFITLVTYKIEFTAKAPFVSKLILAQLKAAITLGFSKLAKSVAS